MIMTNEERVAIEGMEGVRRATVIPSIERSKAEGSISAVPDSEVYGKATRRKFTAEYKLRILKLADNCMESGSLGALLRREGIYQSNLKTWRRQRDDNILLGLKPKKRGRKVVKTNPLQKEVDGLHRENKHLTKQLRQAELIIDVQKKVSEVMGIAMESPEVGEKS